MTDSTPPSIPPELLAAMAGYDKLINSIVSRRPDLDAGEVKGHIQHLVDSTPQSHHQWAESCLARARDGAPMPWEARSDWPNRTP